MKKLIVGLVIVLALGFTGCGESAQPSQKKTQLLYMVEQIKSIDQKKDITGGYRKEVLAKLKAMDTKNSEVYVKNIHDQLVKDMETVVNYKPVGLFEEQDPQVEQNFQSSLEDIDDLVHEVETVTKDMK